MNETLEECIYAIKHGTKLRYKILLVCRIIKHTIEGKILHYYDHHPNNYLAKWYCKTFIF